MLSTTTTTTTTTAPPPDNHRNKAEQQQTQQQPPLKCPRCDSSNTKFCYYNNYSLSQPRYFCKTCRRYWTRGGALRNVPIGGGCRKAKKLKACNTNNLSSTTNTNPSDFGFKFLPTAYSQTSTQFVTSGSGHGFGLDLFGLNFSNPGGGGSGTPSATATDDQKISISSIESLSSINQEMHWKLQQQRMALIYHAEHDQHKGKEHQEQEEGCVNNMFQSLEFSGKVEVGPRSDWSFQVQPTNYGSNSTVNHVGNNNSSDVENGNGSAETASFTAILHDQHGWSDDLHQFNGGV